MSRDPASEPRSTGEAPAVPVPDRHEPLPLDTTSPQLTWRAILTGMILAGLLSTCNVYCGLAIGWGLSMSVVAVLITYGFWVAVHGILGDRVRPLGMLENNIAMTAVAAGAAVSSAGLVAPIPALTLLTGKVLPWAQLSMWIFAVCCLGIIVGIPLRRQMLLIDKLPFPTGLITAETLREVYARGSEAIKRVSMLASFAAIASGLKIVETVRKAYGYVVSTDLGFSYKGFSSKALGFNLDWTLLMYGVGGIIGFRTCLTLIIGTAFAWGYLAPTMIDAGNLRLTVREPLAELPAGIVMPSPEAGLRFRVSGKKRELEVAGVMTPQRRSEYLAMSSDPKWQESIEKLYLRAQLAPSAPLDELPRGGALEGVPVRYDAQRRMLIATGPLNKDALDRLRLASDAPSWTAAVATISAMSTAARAEPTPSDLIGWLLWPGVTLMVISSLVSFAFSWRSVVNSFRFRGATPGEPSTDEVSPRVFLILLVLVTIVLVVLQVWLFGIAVWAAILGIMLSFVLAIVAARVSGETNTTPVGAMGKVTQLVFGAVVPADPAANLMTANVTGGAASQCADLLHDLKTGYLVGASPRKQVFAQICGVFAGALVASYAYQVLIPDPAEQLLSKEWPAPAVATWKAVAELFMVGFKAIPAGTPTAMLIAAIAGIALPILDKLAPKGLRPFILSPAALGLAFVITPNVSLAMFIGATISLLAGRFFPTWSSRFVMTICAGIVAGETLTGVGIAAQRAYLQLGAK